VTVKRSDDRDTADEQVIHQLDEVTSALDNLSAVLDREEELAVVLRRVCQQVIRAIPGADMASVSLLHDDGARTAAVSEDHATEVDEAQYESGQGPCLEAAATGKLVRADKAESRGRWPRFTEMTSGNAVDSYLSAPLFIDRKFQGSLNLYGGQTDGFRKLDAALLELFTTAAEAALRGAQRYIQARETADQLRIALTSRAVIDQAKGIVMGARRVPADEAFALLVAQSQRENTKLREVAERLVTRIIQPGS
jgi:GAF domain-containing protein